jgi:hypothetical protein
MAHSGVAVVFRYTVSIVSRLDMNCKHTRSHVWRFASRPSIHLAPESHGCEAQNMHKLQ